ncbi:MAG: hypothetical protein NC429_02075 [Lachnospiraceae bacterium]|nr:hypothetical protein [Lachnospiraceae bacterium]
MNYFQENTNLLKNKKAGEVFFLILSAFVILMLASRSSFLYPCNNWDDANSYFSVGKALFNGKMPYRDVFDQKGMYLYFLYGLAYLVSHTTFLGVFFLEIILAAADLLGIFRILQLYVKRGTALLLTPVTLAAAFCSKSFYWGGSAEEICYPFLVWGLYLSLAYFKNDYPQREMSRKTLFIGGILAGIAANIKFTVLGLFFAWMMCAAFAFLVRKDFWGAVKACLIFLFGMAVPFVPWLIYFGVQNGLYEWYFGYVYVNVFAYSNLNTEGPGLYERVYTLAKLLYWLIRDNFVYFVFVIAGCLWIICGRKRKLLERFNLLTLCFFLFLGIYVGGSELPYYSLPLSIFTALGVGFCGKILEWTAGRLQRRQGVFGRLMSGGAGIVLGMLFSLAVCAGMVWSLSMNIPFMSEKREDLFLYQFKEIVEETENPTLLNISCLDAGLYTVCDIVPTCRWFQTQTIHLDDVLKDQEQYIREGRTDYIIARNEYPDVIWDKYELAAQAPWHQGDLEFTFYLFRLKNS